jgi:hypothetical protein
MERPTHRAQILAIENAAVVAQEKRRSPASSAHPAKERQWATDPPALLHRPATGVASKGSLLGSYVNSSDCKAFWNRCCSVNGRRAACLHCRHEGPWASDLARVAAGGFDDHDPSDGDAAGHRAPSVTRRSFLRPPDPSHRAHAPSTRAREPTGRRCGTRTRAACPHVSGFGRELGDGQRARCA